MKTLSRIAGQILQVDYDRVLSLSDDECCYSLTQKEVAMVLSQTAYFGWKTRWNSETETEIDTDIIEALQSGLERKLMSGCCPDEGVLHRFTSEGVYQTSSDGGETWVDDPTRDPRNDAIENPHLTGEPSDNKRCAAADNVRGLFVTYRDNLASLLEASPTLVGIVAGILAFIAVLTGISGVAIGLSVLIMGLASFLLTLTPTELNDAITDTVLDDFRCLVYCRMDQDGLLTYDSWQGLLADIATTFADFPELFFYQTVNTMGYIGVNNAGSTGPVTADDCGDCGCSDTWCYDFDFTLADGSEFVTVSLGTWTDGTGWVGVPYGSGGGINGMEFNFSEAQVRGISMIHSASGYGGYQKLSVWQNLPAGGVNHVLASDPETFNGADIQSLYDSFDITNILDRVTLYVDGAGSSNATVKHVSFWGTGVNPFGDSNCMSPE